MVPQTNTPQPLSSGADQQLPGPQQCTETTHELLKHSELWLRCLFVGWQPGLGRELYEMRNCPRCQSSLCRQVDLSSLRYHQPELPA